MVCCFDKTGSTTLVVWLTAILCTQFVAAGNQTLDFSSPMPRDHDLKDQLNSGALNESALTISGMQTLIRKESGEDRLPVDCCPTIKEMVEPQGGRNLDGMYVELYRNGKNVQRFIEYSCKPDVVGKPCRFISRKLQAQSRCVQTYSYTYAIVKTMQQESQSSVLSGINGTSSWTLDYVSIRSGCSCEISPKPSKS